MPLLAVVVVAALAAGRLAGGRLAALGELRVRGGALALAALAADFGAAALGGGVGRAALTAAAAALAGAFLLRNRRLSGLALVSAGLAANALVVVLNGAMPVSAYAAGRAGVATGSLEAGADPGHAVAGRTTRLAWLGDVVPVALPVRPEVASPGDLLVAAGLGLFVASGMLGGRGTTPTVGWTGRKPGGLRWPRKLASAAPGPSARPTTASGRTPNPARRGSSGRCGPPPPPAT